jgi:hypothetical protein
LFDPLDAGPEAERLARGRRCAPGSRRPPRGGAGGAGERPPAAKAAGITLFTIGLGDDLDRAALAAMASRPEWFCEAARVEDLEAIYRTVAVGVPSPADRYWRGRP